MKLSERARRYGVGYVDLTKVHVAGICSSGGSSESGLLRLELVEASDFEYSRKLYMTRDEVRYLRDLLTVALGDRELPLEESK